MEEAIRFLAAVPPFQFLEPGLLRKVAGCLTMAFYPTGAIIRQQDGPAGESLHIIKKGAVKISFRSEAEEQELVVDYREVGETFGLVSLLGGLQKTTIIAMQDTICYLLPKAELNQLMATHPALTGYLLQFHLTKYVDMTSREIRTKSMFMGSSDHVLFTTKVGQICCLRAPVTVPPEASIQETARRMVREKQSAAVVVDLVGSPLGIVTDTDLREKVVAGGCPLQAPVSVVMTTPVAMVDFEDQCFDVILKMLQNNIHHVAVTRAGLLRGVITNHDFMVLQGRSPLAFSEDIAKQRTIEGLAPVSLKAMGVVGALLREGARATNIIRIISELNDRIVRKVLEIGERELGRPPVPYAWLALGSEGRKEQTFRTDQDNAIVYGDPPDEVRAEAEDYFRRFASFVNEGLVTCGFEACPANYMASNPAWCQPLSVWKRSFSTWISEPTPEAVLKSLVFFDFRGLAGEESLVWALKDHLFGEIPRYPAFLGFLANALVRNRPPLGFFGAVRGNRGAKHKEALDLKVKGVAPVVDIVRFFALEKGLKPSSTVERIRALRATDTMIEGYADELDQAFEFMSMLRIHHQFRQMEEGLPIDNELDLEGLSNLELQSLKSSFRLVTKIQDLLMERYRAFVI